MFNTKWDLRFLELAATVASWSKDPSTQTGAVITDQQNRVISLGYNGFPRGIDDNYRLNDRETKYSLVVHAEMNAILNSPRPVDGGTVYIHPFMPCDRCCVHLVQAGIKRVVSVTPSPDKLERWAESFEKAKAVFKEADIHYYEYDDRRK